MKGDFIKELGYLGFATRLKRLSDSLMQDGRRMYESIQEEIEPNWYLIFKILKQHKKLSVTEISQRLQLSHPSVISITNKMDKAGYIISVKSDVDNRKRVLSLSNKAIDKLPDYEKIWDAGTKAVEDALVGINGLEYLDQLENRFSDKNFKQRTLEELRKKPLDNLSKSVHIIDYNKKFAKNFAEINFQWLETYFYIEDYDHEVLTNPEQYILDPGGHILFARYKNKIIGTVALIVREEGNYELSKMGVLEKYRGLNVGKLLMEAAIQYSKEKQIDKLWLDSNRKLNPALNLYKKYGFKEIPVDPNTPYERCNIRMELILNSD